MYNDCFKQKNIWWIKKLRIEKKGKNCGKLKRQEKRRSEILENKKVGDLESLEKSGKSGKTGKQTYFRNMIEKMREFENPEKNSEIR